MSRLWFGFFTRFGNLSYYINLSGAEGFLIFSIISLAAIFPNGGIERFKIGKHGIGQNHCGLLGFINDENTIDFCNTSK